MEQVNSSGTALKKWEEIHAARHKERENIRRDDWLDAFRGYIDRCGTPILDLGCGGGNNTLYLTERGKVVIPCDYSTNAITGIKKNFPEVQRAECFDMADGLPFEDDSTDIVIADLSLHYFSNETTFYVLNEIKRVLRPDGILLFRVNSVSDTRYGAGEGVEIERHFYQSEDGRQKRFFDRQDIDHFFEHWDLFCLEEDIVMRYEHPKQVWKGAAKL